MASEVRQPTVEQQANPLRRPAWETGIVGGLLGGLVMGIVFSVLATPVLESAIPALYGLEGGTIGWAVHMSHSAVFGVVFAAVVSRPRVGPYADSAAALLGLGLGYGAALWVVAAGVVMPVWLDAVGFAGAPPLPNFDPTSLLAHLVFGAVLGAAYWAMR